MKLLLLFFLFPFVLAAQTVSGRVVDAKGEALAFTSIWVENSNQGTLANEDGRFELRLKQGKSRLIFRHLGFAPKPIEVELNNQESQENVIVIMQEQAVALDEINVRALKEDPAIGIMRRMIAMAPFHLKELNSYQAKAYVKGGGKITSISKLADLAIGKQLEKDAGIKVGRTYVLEGINQVTYKRPNQVQERVISNRSNLPLALKGADSPNLRATQTNFYQPKVWGSLISPIAPQAFQFYNFSFSGSFTQGGKTISKIQVRPKSYAVDLFDGELLVVEDTWSIYSLRLNFKNSSGSFTLSQQNAEFQGVWMPINYEMRANLQVMGFGFAVNYVTQIKSYQIQVNPGFVVKPQIIEERLDKDLAKEIDRTKVVRDPRVAFSGEITRKKLRKVLKQVAKDEVKEDSLAKQGISGVYEMTVDSLAPTHSEDFWNKEREVPLTEAEIKGFKEADSLYVFERAKMSKDSLNALPKFKFSHLFFAKRYSYEKNGLGNSFSIGMFGVGFTPVDGFYLNRDLFFNRQRTKTDYVKVGAYLRYAFARNGFNGDFYIENKSDEGRNQFNLTSGSQVANFSSAKTLPMTLNSSAALFDSKSYLYWYQKDFAQVSFSRQVRASFQWRAELEFRNRSPLTNVVSNGRFQRQNSFRENYPLTKELAETRFVSHNQWSLGASVTWKPGSTWRLINQVRRVARSENNLTMKLETQVVMGDFGFSRVGIQVDQTVNLNRLGQFAYQIRYDDFIVRPRVFMDFTHFNGNDLNVISSLPYGFSTLPMYQFSTSDKSLVFHAKWSPRKLLYTQSQWFYMYGLREHIRFSTLQTISNNGKDGFYEAAYSLQGIFRTFGLEVAKPIGHWLPSEWKLSITAPF